MDHPDTLPAEQALSARRPHRGIFQINHADPQSFELPLDYYHKLCIVVGWSNGWSECSTKKRKDHVLVAKVMFDMRPDLTGDGAPPKYMYRFSDKWLEGSGWGVRAASSDSCTFWPLPYWKADGPYPAGEFIWPQPYLCLDVLYEVPLEILEETFSADGLRCECAVDDFEEVEKVITKKEHIVWSEQRGCFEA